MSSDIIQHSSVAGELAKNMWGRTDFEKYDAAWARAHNWQVDYRGPLYTRAGSEFGDLVERVRGETAKIVEFQYAPDIANTYACIFTDEKVRFVQDNAYVLEDAVTIGSVANGTGDRITITATSHGYADGDWVKCSGFTDSTLTFLNGRTVQVANKTTNTFDLWDPITGALITEASINTDTGSAYRIYTITSPYAQEDLARLYAVQIRDYVRLMHPDYPIKNLIRNDATDWEITNESIGSAIAQVTNLALDATSHAEACTFVYQVAAIGSNGEEGVPAVLIITNAAAVMDEVGRKISISWDAVTGAVYYRIYRSIQFRDGTTATVYPDCEVGYIGRTVGPQFSDPGITPDFSQQPNLAYNPFANGRINYVSVTTDGTGYSWDSTISWPSGGSGAVGFLIVPAAGGAVSGVRVLNGGEGYTGTSVSAGTGTGFAGVADLSPSSGNNPVCGAVFQQRMVYGATANYPLRLFGSKAGLLSNFDASQLASASDSYEFDVDAEVVSPMRHLVPIRGGILSFFETGVWLVYGPGEKELSTQNARADPQTAVGASYVRPIYVDTYVLYCGAAGQELIILAYNDSARAFVDQNLSLLSNHLFSDDNPILNISFSKNPRKIVYAVQSNGRMLSLTIDANNSVYACTPLWTQGKFLDVKAIDENNRTNIYVLTERRIESKTVTFFERLVDRKFATIDDAFCVDAGLTLTKTAPDGWLMPSSFSGAVTFTVEGATPFTAGDVGKVLRCGYGKATITGYTSSSVITGTWSRGLDTAVDHEPEDEDTPKTFATGNWWLDATTTELTGLWHLEGKSVAVLADGTVVTGKTVTDGKVTLATAASRITVGLGFQCIAQSLPITVSDVPIEGRKKDIVGVALRIYETAALKYGSSLSKLRVIADRAQRLWNREDRLRNEVVYAVPASGWSIDNQIYFVQDSPLPATILNFVRDTDVGDDKD